MAPNRSCRRASSNPATGHQGLPRRHGHRTLLALAQVPRIWRARRRLDTGGGHPMLMLRDKTKQRDGLRINRDASELGRSSPCEQPPRQVRRFTPTCRCMSSNCTQSGSAGPTVSTTPWGG